MKREAVMLLHKAYQSVVYFFLGAVRYFRVRVGHSQAVFFNGYFLELGRWDDIMGLDRASQKVKCYRLAFCKIVSLSSLVGFQRLTDLTCLGRRSTTNLKCAQSMCALLYTQLYTVLTPVGLTDEYCMR